MHERQGLLICGLVPAAALVLTLCAARSTAAVTFFVHPDGRLTAADPNLDLAFQEAAGLPIHELDFHEFAHGYIFEPSPLQAGPVRIRPNLLNASGGNAANLNLNGNRLIETFVLVPDIPGIIEGDAGGGAALLNRTFARNGDVIGAAIEFTFSEPVKAFGTWILDDIVEPSRFVLKVTEVGGATSPSQPLESGNGTTLAVEGFIGAVSSLGITKVIVEQQSLGGVARNADFFYLDHVQVGGRLPPEICDNEIDDNNDGKADCADTECELHVLCRENCTDGVDNDGNSLIDCADPDCQNQPQYPACGETLCGDGNDNDADGSADCEDSDCFGLAGCTIERACNDGEDNDLDGRTDCSDPECSEDIACGEDCSDGVDNDADGLVDCQDLECMAQEVCPSICESLAQLSPASGCPDSLCFVEPGCEAPPGFFVRPDGRLHEADADGDLLFQTAAGELTEFSFHQFGNGHLVDPPDLFTTGGQLVRPVVLNASGEVAVDLATNGRRLIETYPFVPAIAGIIEGGEPTGSALINRTVDAGGSNVVGAAIEFSFSRPIQAFGTWVLEDFVEPSRFVLKITDVTGTTYISPPLDSHNGSTLAVEGFIAAVSQAGIVKAVVEQQGLDIGGVGSPSNRDFFYLDHVQVGMPPCHDPFADLDGDGDVDQSDFGEWQLCLGAWMAASSNKCACLDRAGDGHLDAADFASFRECLTGPGQPADVDCD